MSEFLMITLMGGLMIISPGPDFLIVVKNTLQYGRQAGFWTAAGIGIATLWHVMLNVLGVSFIFRECPTVFTAMKIGGALYLMYLGYQGLRSQPKETGVALGSPLTTPPHPFKNGFLGSLLNPKAFLFFLSFFSAILSKETPLSLQIGYGLWLAILALGWFMGVAFFLSHTVIEARLQAWKHRLEQVSGGVLVLFGIKLLSSDFS